MLKYLYAVLLAHKYSVLKEISQDLHSVPSSKYIFIHSCIKDLEFVATVNKKLLLIGKALLYLVI